MQRYKFLFAAVLFGVAGLALVPRPLPAADVSISVFHQQLAPYGRWVVAGSYGNVWVPRVAAGWVPYTDGEWVYTDYGWTWVSYDPWGDTPCHYGGWAWADSYGWVWAPGTVWAPAWVTWAYSDDYVGWAPIPPSFALSVSGYAGAAVVLPAARYVFVPTRQFVGVRVSTVRIATTSNVAIFARAQKTTAFNVSGGFVRTAGPPPARIEKVTAHKIAPVSIESVKTRPTTLAQAGAHSGSRVAVAAPEKERARLAEKSEAPVAAKKTEKTGSEPSHSASAKAAPSNPAGHADKPKSVDHGEKNAPQGEANASTKAKSKPKVAAEKPSHAEASKVQSPKPAPHKVPAAPPEQSRNEETRVASHETKHAPATAHSQKPAPKPKAPEHPQPPKEEKPGDKAGP